jgi:hypothetical protein
LVNATALGVVRRYVARSREELARDRCRTVRGVVELRRQCTTSARQIIASRD